MKYKVSWEETVRHETIVEADSPEQAKQVVMSGMDLEDDEVSEKEFEGVTMVEEVR